MKRTLITLTTLALLGASAPAARAHDRGWSTAGKVLTGVGAGLLLSRALEPTPVYAGTPVYVSPAPVVLQQPATVVVQQPVQQQVIVQQPATVVTQPVVVQQPAVVYQPAPVVYAPAPVVVAAPVYRPAYCGPVIGFGFSFGGGRYHHYRHW